MSKAYHSSKNFTVKHSDPSEYARRQIAETLRLVKEQEEKQMQEREGARDEELSKDKGSTI